MDTVFCNFAVTSKNFQYKDSCFIVSGFRFRYFPESSLQRQPTMPAMQAFVSDFAERGA